MRPDVEAFVQAAVRLPHQRLRKIDRSWASLASERRVVSEVAQDSDEMRLEVYRLKQYLIAQAHAAGITGDDSGAGSLLPEEVAEAIFPAARAVLLRDLLQGSGLPERAEAYSALTAPFADVLPESR
ncbi:MAG: hypothetical protein ACJ8BF_15400 [Gemmatimonadales bacterium]